MKTLTVTIAIPAHNEEKSILTLLESLSNQKVSNFNLDGIVVLCDGCTDNTVRLAKEFGLRKAKISVVEDNERVGKIERLNRLYKNCNSDIVVTIDADVILKENDAIEKLVSTFNDSSVGLAGGLEIPAKAETKREKIFYAWYRVWYEIRKNINHGISVHNHAGCISAVHRSIYSSLSIPKEVVAEDEFLFFATIKNGKKFVFVPEAKAIFHLPKTFKEYFIQSARHIGTKNNIVSYFGSDISVYYKVSTYAKITAITKVFMSDPVYTPLSLIVQIAVRIYIYFAGKNEKTTWEMATTTKKRGYSETPKPSRAFIALRNSVYCVVKIVSKTIPSLKENVIVLCYHSISTDGWRFSVNLETLKDQTSVLLKDRQPMKAHELEQYIKGTKSIPTPSFLITFDDGYEDVLQSAPYFKEKNIQPIIFVLSDRKNVQRDEIETGRPFLSTSQILELKNAGFEIGCHSATHPNLSLLNTNELEKEITNSKKSLENELGFEIKYFCYPKGIYNEESVNIVKKSGYHLAFSMDDNRIVKGSNPYTIGRTGVDGTHSLEQFPLLFNPLALALRKCVKKFLS